MFGALLPGDDQSGPQDLYCSISAQASSSPAAAAAEPRGRLPLALVRRPLPRRRLWRHCLARVDLQSGTAVVEEDSLVSYKEPRCPRRGASSPPRRFPARGWRLRLRRGHEGVDAGTVRQVIAPTPFGRRQFMSPQMVFRSTGAVSRLVRAGGDRGRQPRWRHHRQQPEPLVRRPHPRLARSVRTGNCPVVDRDTGAALTLSRRSPAARPTSRVTERWLRSRRPEASSSSCTSASPKAGRRATPQTATRSAPRPSCSRG